jgi:hypothetical protein
MFDGSYIREQYSNFNKQLLTSSFMVNATIYIISQGIKKDSFGDIIDARADPVKALYAKNLESFYRIKVLPLERISFNISDASSIAYTMSGKFEPYDKWIMCSEFDVKILNDRTIFDVADYVEMERIKYRIKGIVPDKFGVKTVLHIFLTKEDKK